MKDLFKLNPDTDRQDYAERFRRDGRVQVRDVLTTETAQEIRSILARHTPWGMGWQTGEGGTPAAARAAELQSAAGRQKLQQLIEATHKAAAEGEYAFRYARYPMLDAYREQWNQGGPHDMLLEYLNTPETLDLIRDVTGIREIIKGDAQATLFAPGHFLAKHTDSHVDEGWQVAYVLNFGPDEWKPDWGGYLNFLDDEGDVITGYRPRFNSLNLFKVPQAHQVTFVPPFAPTARFAITGWYRDR